MYPERIAVAPTTPSLSPLRQILGRNDLAKAHELQLLMQCLVWMIKRAHVVQTPTPCLDKL